MTQRTTFQPNLTQKVTVPQKKETRGFAYCPICTHTVEVPVVVTGKTAYVKPGEKCPRCASALEAAVVRYLAAA